MLKRALFLLLAISFLPLASFAQEMETDRPDQTDSPFIVPSGTVQIEMGASRQSDNGIISYTAPALLARIGLTESAELRLGAEGVSGDNPAYSNLNLGLKNSITKGSGWIPAIALITTLNFSGEYHPASDYVEPELKLSLSHSLSNVFSLAVNCGGGWHFVKPTRYYGIGPTNEEIRNPIMSYAELLFTTSLGIDIAKDLSGFLEAYASKEGDENTQVNYDGGLQYTLLENLKIDGAFGFGSNDGMNSKFVTLGISWRIPR